jgi:hypothetical protein
LTPGSLLHAYWGAAGFHRPAFDLYLAGPGKQVICVPAQIDCASDYTVFAAKVAHGLGLSLPFPRQAGFTGAGGSYSGTASFPPDGQVSLFVTDFHEYVYLPGPLIGFQAPGAGQRSVLGLSGFLQYFRYVQEPSPARIELDPVAGFAGVRGQLPLDRGLYDFIAQLRGAA